MASSVEPLNEPGRASSVGDDARFRLLADNAPVMLWMSGLDGLCDFFNSTWLEFTGRSLEQERGNGWAEGVHADEFQDCMERYLVSFVAREAFRMEYRLRRKDGQYRWILDHGVPRYSESGAFEGFIGSCIDITDMRESSEALRARTRAEERYLHRRGVVVVGAHVSGGTWSSWCAGGRNTAPPASGPARSVPRAPRRRG